MAEPYMVPWTSPGLTLCCCEEETTCQTDVIEYFYGQVGLPPYTRVDISPATAALLKQGSLISWRFEIQIEGITPDGNSTMSGGMVVNGTTTLSSFNNCSGSVSIEPGGPIPSFILEVAAGGAINAFVRHSARIFLQQEGGGWPGGESPTTNQSPALFIVSSGQITWGAIWGHNWVVKESGDQPFGTFFGKTANATFTPRASFNNAAISSIEFTLNVGAP